MKLFLIRHGETTDNVAGRYAGTTDSPLTTHGVLQATRLGQYLTNQGVRFTDIFSSDLQRAKITAYAVRDAQNAGGSEEQSSGVPVTQLASLREQDFGSYEGKPFHSRSKESNKSGKDLHREQHLGEEGFQDVESKESMIVRVEDFLDKIMLPVLLTVSNEDNVTVGIVSHGIILSVLWRSLLRRLPPRSVTLSPTNAGRTIDTTLEYLGGWSNTGYLEVHLSRDSASVPQGSLRKSPASESTSKTVSIIQSGKMLVDFRATIVSINSTEHLVGLKRTGSGIGSSRFDESQRSIDAFFRKIPN